MSDIEEFLDMSQPNVSHHLSLLRRYCACCPVTKKGTYPEERRHC
ncbi:MAG: ArsR family transcriptional regulator [Thermodesulfovibrionales bacterium]